MRKSRVCGHPVTLTFKTAAVAWLLSACAAEADHDGEALGVIQSQASKKKTSEPSFNLASTLASVGTIVRGGPAGCPPASEPDAVCNCLWPECGADAPSFWEPKNVFLSYEGCVYQSHQVVVSTENGFSGTVSLELLGLPPGVVSETPTSIFVPAGFSSKGAPFKLVAAAGAVLGDAVVTVRATSGNILRTLNLPITVQDELPACP
jgi:hypothetical protein